MDDGMVTGTGTAGSGTAGSGTAGSGTAGSGTAGTYTPGSGAREAARVLTRLERIEALDRERAPAGRLLGELRELVREAEAWARVEGDARARNAVGKLREGAEGMS
jgi:hypothetical protein